MYGRVTNIDSGFQGRRRQGKKAGSSSARPQSLRLGFTLIELMVVVVIMAIVGSAAFMMFKSTAVHEANQQNVLEQTQNLRTAMYTVSRDARMAGSGLQVMEARTVQVYVPPAIVNSNVQRDPGWFRYVGEDDYGVRAIFGTDSGTTANRSDTLTLFRAEVEATVALGRLRVDFTPGLSSNLVLQASIVEGQAVSDGDILAVSNGDTAVIVEASLGDKISTATIAVGQRFKPAEQHPQGLVFPAGSKVFNLRDVAFVTYYVDPAAMRLMADYHDATFNDSDPEGLAPNLVVVANNIEDFQVGYYFNDSSGTGVTLPVMSPTINGSLLAPGSNWVQAVQLGLVSRSRAKSEADSEGRPIKLMDHQANDEVGFTRRTMTEVIQLRNSGPAS